MARTKPEPAQVSDTDVRTIEQWAQIHKTSAAILAGLKVKENWGAGKQVSDQEYRSALARFLKSPIGGEKR